MPAFCPLCARDDLTELTKADDGTRFAVCLNPTHGANGYIWEPTTPGSRGSQRSNELGAELDVWDKLLTCFNPGEEFVAYGAIEDRFIARYPTEAATLLHRYGHRWRDPEHPAGQYSMSVYMALRLRELEKEGQLELDWGPAEGPWAYNQVISYWRIPH